MRYILFITVLLSSLVHAVDITQATKNVGLNEDCVDRESRKFIDENRNLFDIGEDFALTDSIVIPIISSAAFRSLTHSVFKSCNLESSIPSLSEPERSYDIQKASLASTTVIFTDIPDQAKASQNIALVSDDCTYRANALLRPFQKRVSFKLTGQQCGYQPYKEIEGHITGIDHREGVIGKCLDLYVNQQGKELCMALEIPKNMPVNVIVHR